MKISLLSLFALWFSSIPSLAVTTVSVSNIGIGRSCMPIVSQNGYGATGSWAVGTLVGFPDFFDGPEILNYFDQNGSEGRASDSIAPGFFSSQIDDAATSSDGSDRFTGLPIMIMIGNNPLGLAFSSHFILLDSGQYWEPEETPGIPGSVEIRLDTLQIVHGMLTPYNGILATAFPGCDGVTFLVPISSAGASLASLIDVSEIPDSQGKGGVRVIFDTDHDLDEVYPIAASWNFSDQIARTSGKIVLGLEPGIYTVQFSEVGGFTSPPSWGLDVAAGQLREYRVIYKEILDIQIVSLVRSVNSIALSWELSGPESRSESFAIDYSLSLQDGDWTEVASDIWGVGGEKIYFEDLDTSRLASKTGFYRLREE